MEISLVIPAWNDHSGLRRLLDQVDRLKIFADVIVVDDASEEDLSPAGLGIDIARFSAPLRYIRLAEQGGAGHARNVGLDHVSGSHVIFFDSDDLFGEDITQIVSDADASYRSEEGGFDFCIFRHDDSRVTSSGGRGALEADEKYWRMIGAQPGPRFLSQRETATLSAIAAYPWNKLYNTDFLRSHRIRCTELPVHNDVELHWNSFILAKRILCTARIGAEHYVVDNGGRLTNRRGAERLRVFEAFRNVLACLRTSNTMPFMLEPFTDFCSKLVLWIEANMHGDFRIDLEKKASRFFLEEYSREQMVLLAYRNPDLARRINAIIVEGAK